MGGSERMYGEVEAYGGAGLAGATFLDADEERLEHQLDLVLHQIPVGDDDGSDRLAHTQGSNSHQRSHHFRSLLLHSTHLFLFSFSTTLPIGFPARVL